MNNIAHVLYIEHDLLSAVHMICSLNCPWLVPLIAMIFSPIVRYFFENNHFCTGYAQQNRPPSVFVWTFDVTKNYTYMYGLVD